MNLKQLSARLGLSPTTVSRALNGYPEVNAATRERVLKAARETGYRPNRTAQRLATGKAGSIGLLMPIGDQVISDLHFGEFLSGLGEKAQAEDFHLVVMPSDPADEVSALRSLATSGYVDGLCLAYIREQDSRIDLMESFGLPFVVHGRFFDPPHPYPSLDVDNEAAFYDATRLLLQLGHRRIGLINGDEKFGFAIRRRDGVIKALSEAGLRLDERFHVSAQMTEADGQRAAERFLSGDETPTAMLCSSMVQALGIVRAVTQSGLQLGRDISLISYDDVLPLLRPELFSVPLTTTRSSLRTAGKRVAERLIHRINGLEKDDVQELWRPELVVRASTGRAPG
ncbi:LacI family DNA-binding transcriptional regulator [Martelella lutilitoris]|uniref:LacI family DNA-binding transcriptional regulator n=1 Tax=Martelella lutilitoris TaxID=2583532 RepID=A0A7T7KKQ7_9HYPH|nr:LacI family DNA-binding transcriptional regulator [Martelella lutilitoris]QQM29916.1 LacI family DNA-binding transcriptional regulator [Martelella lutilitoris]